MAPAAVILKQRNGLSIYANTPVTDKFISIESLASLLRSTVTILRPRIVAAPNSPITTLTVTPTSGAPADIEFISESKLPGLLSFVSKAPTAQGLSLLSTQLLQALARYQFSLISFTENFTGSVVGTAQGAGGATPTPTPLNTAATNEIIDARVKDLIVAGVGIAKTYDDNANTLTLSANGSATSGASPGVKTLDNIFTDLATEPIATKLVTCSKYWPGTADTGTGGLFMGRPVTGYVVDNVKVFAASDGVWVRVSDSNYLNHAGAIGKNNNGTFRFSQNPLRNFLPNVLLSDKFTTLAAARAWYPFANILNLTESLNSAALQHLACLGKVNIEDASYWFNRAFEYFSGLVFKGEGSTKSILIFDANNAFKPRLESTTQPGFAEIYKQNISISGIACYGTIPVNANAQLLTTEPTPYDEASAGFYLPRKAPLPNTADATSTNPQMLFASFEDVLLERFAGDGIFLGNVFNAQLEKVRGENNKGFGVHTYTSNSVKYIDCYQGKYNAKGGFWLENGGTLTNCNGPDCFDDRPGVVFGVPGSTQRVLAEVNGGNIEGTTRLIDLHGNGSGLKIINTSLQYYCTDANTPPIRIHGFNCTIEIDTNTVGYTSNSPVLKPTNLMWVRGSGNGHNVKVKNMPPFSGSEYYTYMVVNAAGTDLYGGNGEILYLKPDESRVSLLDYGAAGDIYTKTSQFPKLYVKNQAIGTVDTAAALPTITANPGLYINVNAAATAANKIFIKIGDTNTGWSAL